MKLISSNLTKRLIRCFSDSKIPTISTNPVRARVQKIQQDAYVQYKRYPSLPHQDPNSKQYVASELDEYHERTQVQSFNKIIDQLKHDINVQREVWNAIDKLDRTYKKGIPGIDTNISSTVQKPYLQDLGFQRRDFEQQNLKHLFKNEDSFLANTPFESNFKTSNVIQWEKQIAARPVNKHFHPDKGYKYDVPVKPEQKYQYLADRLGHPEFLGSPLQRLLKLQNDIYHPEYIDQPFVKQPSNKPHESLNFEEGQVVYQNTRVLQWLKFWQAGIFTFAAYAFLFVPYQLTFKTHLVTNLADQLVWLAYHYVSPFNMDTMKLGIPIIAGISAYVVHIALNMTNKFTEKYAVKMSFSKDKELLFVKRIDLHGALYEEVYQTAHLQILPPSVKTGVKDLSSYDEDGIWTITCLNTNKEIFVYNNPNFWNPHERRDFFAKIMHFWDKSYYGYNRKETQQINNKWQQFVLDASNQKRLPN